MTRFVKSSVMKKQRNFLSVNYKSRANENDDKDLVIGQATNSWISNLKPQEQHEFYTSVRNYYITAFDYIHLKFPREDVALINAEVASLKLIDCLFFRDALFFVEKFRAMLLQQV